VSQQPGSSIMKLEWITCPFCSTTFQVAVPAKATDMRVRESKPWTIAMTYCLQVHCINSVCKRIFWIETNLPYTTVG